MNLTLTRINFRSDGILSVLMGSDLTRKASTLEHAYPSPDTFPPTWIPKIPRGIYTCVRGTHQLKNGIPFETFEITGVPGHTGLLFHCGNFDCNSEGCVLLGQNFAKVMIPIGTPGNDMVTNSRAAFSSFMELQEGLQSFQLTVV